MSNPINNSTPRYPNSNPPHPSGVENSQQRPGTARAAAHRVIADRTEPATRKNISDGAEPANPQKIPGRRGLAARRNFFGRVITIAPQRHAHHGYQYRSSPYGSSPYGSSPYRSSPYRPPQYANNKAYYPGTYLPTAPVPPTSPHRVVRAINNPRPEAYFPGAVFTPESGRMIGTSRDPDAPLYSDNEAPDFMKQWVNPDEIPPSAPYHDGPGLPKPRTL